MRGRAALVALIASATADRPQVVVTRSTEASHAPPVLPTAGRAHMVAYSGSTAAQRHTDAKRPLLKSSRNDQKLALRKVLDTSRAVREASRAVNKAKRKLADARRRSSEAREQLVKLEQLKAAAAGGGKARQEVLAAQERALFLARCRTLLLLFGFTFMNGLARRSLSSSAPSLVAEGIVSHPRVEDIFMIGFEVFCVGKLLAVPVLLFLKPRLGLLLHLPTLTLTLTLILTLTLTLTLTLILTLTVTLALTLTLTRPAPADRARGCRVRVVPHRAAAGHAARVGPLPHLQRDGRLHHAPLRRPVVPAPVLWPHLRVALLGLPGGLPGVQLRLGVPALY